MGADWVQYCGASSLPMCAPHCDQSTSPAPWWDRDADKSLVIGTYKHGYESYSEMRRDPALAFLALVGPPPPASLEERMECKLSDEDDESETTGLGISDDISQGDPSEEQPGSTRAEGVDEDPSKPQWPSMGDLNQRLRRVINSYQRNFKKEELKQAQKAKQSLSIGDGQNALDISTLMAARGDWHQLAMYLWKIERREKFEQIVKERERQRIEMNQRKWSKREEQEFLRTISTYGVEYDRLKKKFDWTKFRALSRLDKKFDDTLTEYYLAFSGMCKRICGIKPTAEEETTDLVLDPLPEDRAKRILERISLLSKIREETLCHPQLDERLNYCQPSADIPEWWIPGKHDKDLLLGVAKHGLGRTDFFILNDPELSFHEITKRNIMNLKNDVKLERPEDILSTDKTEIVVKLEKGEGTLKIEKIAVKQEENLEHKNEENSEETSKTISKIGSDTSSQKENESNVEENLDGVSNTKENKTIEETSDCDKNEITSDSSTKLVEKEDSSAMELDNSSEPSVMENQDNKSNNEKEELSKSEEEEKTVVSDNEPSSNNVNENPPDAKKGDCLMKCNESENLSTTDAEKSENVNETNVKVNEVIEENKKITPKPENMAFKAEDVEGIERFKAMFPELEVMQKLPEIDTTVVTDKTSLPVPRTSLDSTVAQLIAHSYQNPIKWPKEHAIQVRLEHIVHCVEHKEWPVSKNFTAYSEDQNQHVDDILRGYGEPSEVITITTDHGGSKSHALPSSKRKRHIAIDVETERAKLHALLNNTNLQLQHPMKHSPSTPWDHTDESLSEESRRSTPLTGLQPPPAHQGSIPTPRMLSMQSYDMKYHQASEKSTPSVPSSPGTMAPIDLSSGSLKGASSNLENNGQSAAANNYMEEVQDFSMPNKKSQQQQQHQNPQQQASKGKLDDMLNKLMQKKNCPVEEPLVGKEKKRRKLDEIVLGLSAAKEQMSEKKSIPPSVTLTLSNKPPSRGPPSSNSSPSPSSKPPDTSYLAEQHSLLLKQQQQLQQQILQQQQALKMSQPTTAAAAQVQRKTYEAMIADISKVADFSAKISSYSHEAKVNKWLAEQSGVMPEQPLSADFLTPRRRRPRVDPTLLDWKKLTGEENVSVINRITGKKLTGSKAPQLKRLAQWLLENPMFDVDPKWAELVKERGNLPHDLQKRLPPGDRKKGPGRPPLLSSPPGASPPVSTPSNLPFPSLGGINPSSLLSGLSIGGFDPKNPLLLPFGGMPNMSVLSSMSGLGNVNLTSSLFANLAGLGLPGLSGMDPNSQAMTDSTTSVTNVGASTSKQPAKLRKPDTPSKTPVSSASSNLPSSLPFFFPNPNLLYSPLGLGGLNPFAPGSTNTYDSLALLNGTLGCNTSVASSTASRGGIKTTNASCTSLASRTSSTITSSLCSTQSSSSTNQRTGARTPLSQQFMLPQDTHLLESLSRAAASATKGRDKQQPFIKSKDVDSLRNLMTGVPGYTNKIKEQEMKETLESLSKSPTELFLRISQSQESCKDEKGAKRTRESTPVPEDNSITKKIKSDVEESINEEVNLKAPTPTSIQEQPPDPPPHLDPVLEDVGEKEDLVGNEDSTTDSIKEEEGTNNNTNSKKKKVRAKKSPISDVVERKNLRSSAGRAAAAAAARQRAASLEQQQEQPPLTDA